MAQSGFTPIQIYYSTTTSNVPTAGNLADGELAINTADGKLFYKDNGGVVRVIAQTSSVTNVSSISFGSTGLTPSTATTGAVTVAGTLATGNGGTGLTTFTSGGAVYATSTSALTTGTLPVTAGGTGVASATAYSVLTGGTTSTGAFQTVSGTGTSGQVLTSNGAGAMPTWQASQGIGVGKAIAMALIFGF